MKIIKIRQATSKGFVEMPVGGYSMHHNPGAKQDEADAKAIHPEVFAQH